ncbi:MAG: hypothetical protein K0S79_2193 [Nitrospira sp.]|nr:hypothetical protein [Nitrospira sp.]
MSLRWLQSSFFARKPDELFFCTSHRKNSMFVTAHNHYVHVFGKKIAAQYGANTWIGRMVASDLIS